MKASLWEPPHLQAPSRSFLTSPCPGPTPQRPVGQKFHSWLTAAHLSTQPAAPLPSRERRAGGWWKNQLNWFNGGVKRQRPAWGLCCSGQRQHKDIQPPRADNLLRLPGQRWTLPTTVKINTDWTVCKQSQTDKTLVHRSTADDRMFYHNQQTLERDEANEIKADVPDVWFEDVSG